MDPITEQNKRDLYLRVYYDGNDLQKEIDNRVSKVRETPVDKQTALDKKIINAATYYYAQTIKINMDEIVWRDDIDLFRTVSNHSHEILERFWN